jgi:hypothetical protein
MKKLLALVVFLVAGCCTIPHPKAMLFFFEYGKWPSSDSPDAGPVEDTSSITE